MKLDNIISLHRFEWLANQYLDRFNDYEQKFIVNMIADYSESRSISLRQLEYCETLLARMKTYHELAEFRQWQKSNR
jgi:hypothetical protein